MRRRRRGSGWRPDRGWIRWLAWLLIVGSVALAAAAVFVTESSPWWLRGLSALSASAGVLLGLYGDKLVAALQGGFDPPSPDSDRHDAHWRALARQILDQQLAWLDRQDRWSDDRYVDLDAELELSDGQRRPWTPSLRRQGKQLSLWRSLSRVLDEASDPLVVLKGEPGAGKSVTLRHITKQLCEDAVAARYRVDVLPVYVNLRGLQADGQAVNAQLVRDLVVRTLNRTNDPRVASFLNDEFDGRMVEGGWLFLFDSFDEIPELLSVTETGTATERYEQALRDFVTTLSRCRGVIASREFRGPAGSRSPSLRILPLSPQRMRSLVEGFGLAGIEADLVFDGLTKADPKTQELSRNPQFLSLLCAYVADRHMFPPTPHSVFDDYVTKRLSRDEQHMVKRFALTPDRLRRIAEELAFCMTAEHGVGLEPRREKLCAAMRRHGFSSGPDALVAMDALQGLQLAEPRDPGDPDTFAFRPRRLQEYFATRLLLDEPTRVAPNRLLTDGSWRETTVTILQLQPENQLRPILRSAQARLRAALKQVPDAVEESALADPAEIPPEVHVQIFPWPRHTLHLLGVLDAGLINRTGPAIESLRVQAGRLLATAYARGSVLDRKWALDVAGVAPQPVLTWMLRAPLGSETGGRWLRQVAMRQIGRLHTIPEDIAQTIRSMLIGMALQGALDRERETTETLLRSFERPQRFLDIVRLLLTTPLVDLGLQIAFVPLLFIVGRGDATDAGDLVIGSLIWSFLLSLLAYLMMSGALALRRASFAVSVFVIGVLCGVLAVVARITFVAGLAQRFDPWISVPIALVGLLAVTWPLGALAAAATGRYTRPGQWWLAHAAIPVGLRRIASLAPGAMLRRWRQGLRRRVGIGVLAASVLLVLWILATLPADAARELVRGLPGSSALLVLYEVLHRLALGCLVLLLGALVWPVLVLFWMAATASAAERRIKRWIASNPSSMTTQELLDLLGQVRGKVEGSLLISTIRRRGLLDDVPEAITVLEDVIVATERSSRWASDRVSFMPLNAEVVAPLRHGARLLRKVGRRLVGRPRTGGPGHEPEPSPIGQARDPDVQRWFARLTRWTGPSRLLYLDGPDLDQMGLLLEHLRRRRDARQTVT
jgi:hypothetical protein